MGDGTQPSRIQSRVVIEPDPAGGSDLNTSYTYTPRDQLAQVTMVRDGYTQTRTFNYSGAELTSATNPENGTVTYTYNNVHQVTTRTDAKGQVTQYTYDSYGRLIAQQYYLPLNGDLVEDTSQAVTYTYDSNPYGGSNVVGRLGVVNFGQSRYDYSYNTAGRVTQQNLHTWISFPDANGNKTSYWEQLTAAYGWDNEGRMTSTQSPAGTYNYSFDAMGRLGGMTDGDSNPVASATYGLTGQLSTLWTNDGTTEARTYNSLMQLTRQTVNGGAMDMEYRYTAGQNNGRITQSKDWVTGEEVNYTYDSLQRLTAAATTGSGGWGTAYGYDGFGNLWTKSDAPGKLTPTGMSVTYDRTTNHQDGVSYDANGNPATINGVGVAWDEENRLAYQDGYWGLPYWYWQGHGLPVPPAEWEYDPWGKRVQSPGANGTIRVSLYNLGGQVLYQMDCNTDYYNEMCSPVQSFQYFGRKVLKKTDRLGSVRSTYNSSWPPGWQETSYYPYGEDKDNPQPDGTMRFATYLRDGAGVDYAMGRYYSSTVGRFYTPDPGGMKAANPRNPGSWNRYAYAHGDPVNFHDPSGRDADSCPTFGDGDDDGPCGEEGGGGGDWGWGGWDWSYGGPPNPGDYPGSEGPAPTWPPPVPGGGIVGPLGWMYETLSENCTTGTYGGVFDVTCAYGMLLAPLPSTTIKMTLPQLLQSLSDLLGSMLGAVVLGITNPKPLGGLDEICWEQYQADLDICRQLHSPSCYDQAAQRYANCLAARGNSPENR